MLNTLQPNSSLPGSKPACAPSQIKFALDPSLQYPDPSSKGTSQLPQGFFYEETDPTVCFGAQEMKAFWVPSMGPESKALLEKPEQVTYCPASGKKLRMKDLTSVKFTRVPEGETGMYMDPITKDNFTDSSKLVLLKPTGKLLRVLPAMLASGHVTLSVVFLQCLF